jgi:type II secretory pathway pseudopilin PulG
MIHKRLTWLLVVLTAATPSLLAAQEPNYITSDAVFGAVIQVKRVLTAPEMEMLPVEVLSAASKQESGIDPIDIKSFTVMVEVAAGPPEFGAVVNFEEPFAWKNLKAPRGSQVEEAELAGRPYLRSTHPASPGFYMPNDTTLLIGSDAMIGKMLVQGRKQVRSDLGKQLMAGGETPDLVAAVVLDPIRPLLEAQLEQAPLPPPLEDIKRIPALSQSAQMTMNVANKFGGNLELRTANNASAKELNIIVNDLLDMGQELALAQIASQIPPGDDPVQIATQQYGERITRLMFHRLRPKLDGDKLVVNYEDNAGGQVAIIGVLVALLLPAVQAAREAARRMSSSNNLKQIAIAMHNYHDVHKHFPPSATFDEDGKPLLSWRVHLLPYLEEQALYKEFKLDEPWDSQNNIKLIDRMPMVFRNPSSPMQGPVSHYLLPTGKGTIFADPKKDTSFRDVRDGSVNTLLVLEVNGESTVTWTKPGDFEHKADAPLQGLGNAHPGGFLAAFADGSVRFIAGTIDPDLFSRLLEMADGKAVGNF